MTTQNLNLSGVLKARKHRRRRRSSHRLTVRSCGLSDIGYERPNNEDRFDFDDRRRVYVVADGIGSYKHGNVAAQITVESVVESICRDEQAFPRLEPAIKYAHSKIREASIRNPSLDEMGTTVVSLLVDDSGSAMVAHAGDSRAYRLRDGQLELLTRDHTFANQMAAAGHLRPEDADRGPWSNILTRVLSVNGPLEIEVTEFNVREGDVFLLCSDGLTKMLSDTDIHEGLVCGGGPKKICRRLIDEALMQGGHDNVTAVVVEIEEPAEGKIDDTQTITVQIPVMNSTDASVAPPIC